jgi:hypothetical protein
MTDTIYERVCRRLLRESGGAARLAAWVYESSSFDRIAILYDTVALRPIFDDLYSEQRVGASWNPNVGARAAREAIRGKIVIVAPKNPCWGAWEVKMAVAQQRVDAAENARTIYGLGYAMSDEGILMSDRSSVSLPAKRAWMRIFSGKKRRSKEFDDVSLPKEQRRTPDFPGDDCKLYVGSGETPPEKNPQLQHAYESQGWEAGELRWLSSSHETFVAELSAATNDPFVTRVLHRLLKEAAQELWENEYPGEDND